MQVFNEFLIWIMVSKLGWRLIYWKYSRNTLVKPNILINSKWRCIRHIIHNCRSWWHPVPGPTRATRLIVMDENYVVYHSMYEHFVVQLMKGLQCDHRDARACGGGPREESARVQRTPHSPPARACNPKLSNRLRGSRNTFLVRRRKVKRKTF